METMGSLCEVGIAKVYLGFADGVDYFVLQGRSIVVVYAQKFFVLEFLYVLYAVGNADDVCGGGVGFLVASIYFCEVATVDEDAVCVLHGGDRMKGKLMLALRF